MMHECGLFAESVTRSFQLILWIKKESSMEKKKECSLVALKLIMNVSFCDVEEIL